MDQLANEIWYLEIEIVLDDDDEHRVIKLFEQHGITVENAS